MHAMDPTGKAKQGTKLQCCPLAVDLPLAPGYKMQRAAGVAQVKCEVTSSAP